MKTICYLNGKKITRKNMNELLGKAVVKELVLRAKEYYFMDPLSQKVFYMGSYGMVTICFVKEELKLCR